MTHIKTQFIRSDPTAVRQIWFPLTCIHFYVSAEVSPLEILYALHSMRATHLTHHIVLWYIRILWLVLTNSIVTWLKNVNRSATYTEYNSSSKMFQVAGSIPDGVIGIFQW